MKLQEEKKSTKAKIKVFNQEERLKKWMNHFQNLLGKSLIVSGSTIEKLIEQELEIKTGAFNELELDLVLKNLKNKKSSRIKWNSSRSLEN